MRKVSEIVVLAGENCGSQLSVSSQTYFLKTIHQLSMPNGNFKKILAASLCYDDDFYKNVTTKHFHL